MIKSILLVLSIAITASLEIQAQVQLFPKYVEGCYYDAQNTRHCGLINYSYDYSNTVSFKTDKTAKPIKFKPRDIKSFTIEKDSFIVLNNFKGTGTLGSVSDIEQGFAKVVELGRVNLYLHYSSGGHGATYYSIHNYLVNRNGTDAYENLGAGPKSKARMAEYFKDHEELRGKILDGFFKATHLPHIVKKYNSALPQ